MPRKRAGRRAVPRYARVHRGRRGGAHLAESSAVTPVVFRRGVSGGRKGLRASHVDIVRVKERGRRVLVGVDTLAAVDAVVVDTPAAVDAAVVDARRRRPGVVVDDDRRRDAERAGRRRRRGVEVVVVDVMTRRGLNMQRGGSPAVSVRVGRLAVVVGHLAGRRLTLMDGGGCLGVVPRRVLEGRVARVARRHLGRLARVVPPAAEPRDLGVVEHHVIGSLAMPNAAGLERVVMMMMMGARRIELGRLGRSDVNSPGVGANGRPGRAVLRLALGLDARQRLPLALQKLRVAVHLLGCQV